MITTENTPVVMAANLPSYSLQEDQKIIDELTSTANTSSAEVSAPAVEEASPASAVVKPATEGSPELVGIIEEVKPVVEITPTPAPKTETQEPMINTVAIAPAAGTDLDSLI